MSASWLLRLVWLAGGFALVLAWTREPILRFFSSGKPLARAEAGSDGPWLSGGFRDNSPYPSTTPGTLPKNIPRVGSWLDTDAWQGRAETAWFTADRLVHVGVAGYPTHPQCSLTAEFRRRDGSVVRIAYSGGDPREQWTTWEISSPADTTAVRLVAVDNDTGLGGWLAFSHPYRAWPVSTAVWFLHLQVYTTTALALTLLWGPGLLWSPRRASSDFRPAFLLGLGPILLATIGLLIWLLGGWVRPQILGLAATSGLWLALGFTPRLAGFQPPELSPALRRALLVSALAVLAIAAKSSYSAGPEGELFRGTISRNFSVSDRIDSRYSYYLVQAAAHHLNPAAPTAEKMFYPWTFFSRGPLAGLVTLPIVMATDARPPLTPPDQLWNPFDREGFTAYRVTMIALASTIIVAMFFLLVPFAGEAWALIGAGLLALSPFGLHEIMFTWPKWVATTCAVLSFLLAHQRRPFAAGLALGIGFLFHPLVLLWAPWLGLWSLLRAERRLSSVLTTGLRISAGAGMLVLPWIALGTFMPHLPDTPLAGQAGFFRYWIKADWQPATWDTWWRTRWMNFANTFLPLHVVFDSASFHHPKLNSPYGPSPALVKFAQVWWVSLPFGLGLGLWLASFAALLRSCRVFTAATLLFVAAPAVFITAYWGMDPLGLLRECGHPLVIAIIALTCLVAARTSGLIARILRHPLTPCLQLPEVALMFWLTALANSQGASAHAAHLDPLCLAINALALLLLARVLSRARAALAA